MKFMNPSFRCAWSGRPDTGRMWGWAAVAALLLSATPARLGAQSSLLSDINPLGNSRGGLKLYDVSAFGGWESTVGPQGQFGIPYLTNLKDDAYVGGGASMGWSPANGKSGLSIGYTLNYVGQIRYSDLSQVNQALTLGLGRGKRLSAKWTLGLTSSGVISNADQMLFSPTIFGSMVEIPGSFDDLASAFLTGKYNNDQLASLLTGAPVIESPARTLLFGNRVLGASLTPSLTYAHSQRLSISFSSGVSFMQNLNDGRQSAHSQYHYLVGHSLGTSAAVSASYAVTPRTRIGLSGTTSRSFSSFANGYGSTGSAFVSRTMGRHWFAQAHAGAGFVTVSGHRNSGSGATPVYGANLGYGVRAHNFMGGYVRTLSQGYGVGSAHMTNISLAWRWRRPGQNWGLNSSYVREQFGGTSFGNLNGWRASFAVDRRVSEHIMLESSYAYGAFAVHSPLTSYQSSQSAVRLSVIWIPAAERR